MKKVGLSLLGLIVGVTLVSLLVTRKSDRQVEYLREIVGQRQEYCPPRTYVAAEATDRIALGKQLFPDIEGLPEAFSDAFYLALSHYPELQGVQIEVSYSPIPTTLQVQPVPGSLFGKRSKRRYRISINSDEDFEGIFFRDIPFNAKVGLVAHEMGHILDYEHKNFFQINGTALKFLAKGSQMRYEKSIDLLTIYKGLGWQLHDWADYSMIDSYASTDYKQFKKDVYYEPEEIIALMEQYPEICDLP